MYTRMNKCINVQIQKLNINQKAPEQLYSCVEL